MNTMKYLLGIDLGSSSVKVSLVEADSGECKSSAQWPESEAPIKALQPGWAEQRPDDWWQYFKMALQKAISVVGDSVADILAIGISYQMHGLVCLDKELQPLRDAIIWCDSRGVPYGEHAPIPGNFTAAKLAWVKKHEPELFDRIKYIMLPGDWLALRLTGTPATTACGLSEMMLWDFSKGTLSDEMMAYFGFPKDILPPLVPTFGEQGRLTEAVAKEIGLKTGIPVTYRAGDQPNNALSLNVMHPGEIAATAGTSGVVYGIHECVNALVCNCVSDDAPATDAFTQSRINTFLHVNGNLGLMHCINGCGILNSWMRHNVATDLSYGEMNTLAATVPAGSEGLSVIPFGNGAERVLNNRDIGASVHGLSFNRHSRAHLLRATQEGIAFAFMYGMEIMFGGEKLKVKGERYADAGQNFHLSPFTSHLSIHAGRANLFLSPLFRETLSSLSGATIHLYDTDGSQGAARGAGLGADIYSSEDEAFASLKQLAIIEPCTDIVAPLTEAYGRWKSKLEIDEGL